MSGVLDLPPDVELVVEVRGALPFQARDLAFAARLLDQPRVARGDRLGERELVRLSAPSAASRTLAGSRRAPAR
jgi:hypothetical protein